MTSRDFAVGGQLTEGLWAVRLPPRAFLSLACRATVPWGLMPHVNFWLTIIKREARMIRHDEITESMHEQPTLQTERLILRPFTLADAPDVQCLAGDRAIASTTGNIAHPYEDGMAEQWISGQAERFRNGEAVELAVTMRAEGCLIGAIGLHIHAEASRAELGYWIGKPYWGQGYATEAAQAVVQYGFEELGLNRICACHFGSNPASGRVMQKIGMAYEGCRRQHFCKWEVFEDCVDYAILRSEYESYREQPDGA